MNRALALAVAVAIGAAAVVGLVAVTKTAHLGGAARRASAAQIAAKSRTLDRFEASLARALAKPTPRLPKVPHVQAPALSPVASPGTVVYRRAPAIVVVKHRAHTDDGAGEEDDGGGGDA